MKLSRKHIDPRNGEPPFRKIAFLEMTEKLDPKLKPLLWEELSAGNYIWEAGSCSPEANSLCVSLSHPFKKVYGLPIGARFIEDKDPHCNTARYEIDSPVSHILSAPLRK